jgi:hypothetical protein
MAWNYWRQAQGRLQWRRILASTEGRYANERSASIAKRITGVVRRAAITEHIYLG